MRVSFKSICKNDNIKKSLYFLEPVNNDDIPTNNQNILENPSKKKTRWKESEPNQWKKNVAKRQKIEAKAPKQIDCSKCRFKCTAKFSVDNRLIICKNYWSCDFNRRIDFILNNVESKVPERRRAKCTITKKPREDSKFFFSLKWLKSKSL